jgi:hypothetical protein
MVLLSYLLNGETFFLSISFSSQTFCEQKKLQFLFYIPSLSLNFTSMNRTNYTFSRHAIPPTVRFWTYLIFDILSVACSLFVLNYLLFDRTLHRAFSNHVIIVLLSIGFLNELISVPWILYLTQVILVAWATLERHILIFHQKWVSTRNKRFFFHYLPIIAILIYCLIYYSIIIVGPFCKNSFVYYLAGGLIIPCVYSNRALALWELVAHQAIPTLIIIIFSIALIGRIVRKKQKVDQPIRWRDYRNMTIQLSSISVLYLIFNIPWTIILFAFQYGLPANMAAVWIFYGIYFRTYVIFLYPFICFGSSTELRNKLKKKFFWRRQHRVYPQ